MFGNLRQAWRFYRSLRGWGYGKEAESPMMRGRCEGCRAREIHISSLEAHMRHEQMRVDSFIGMNPLMTQVAVGGPVSRQPDVDETQTLGGARVPLTRARRDARPENSAKAREDHWKDSQARMDQLDKDIREKDDILRKRLQKATTDTPPPDSSAIQGQEQVNGRTN